MLHNFDVEICIIVLKVSIADTSNLIWQLPVKQEDQYRNRVTLGGHHSTQHNGKKATLGITVFSITALNSEFMQSVAFFIVLMSAFIQWVVMMSAIKVSVVAPTGVGFGHACTYRTSIEKHSSLLQKLYKQF
jgi:hypothetical protein